VSRQRLVLGAWGMLVLGLVIRAFAAGALPHGVPAVSWRPHRVDANRAGVDELTVLPGIGRTRAEAIVVERIRNGPFRKLEDLERVDGLGPAAVQALRGMVEFSMPAAPR